MVPVTNFDPSCKQKVLFDKQISKVAFRDNFELF